MGIDMKRVRGSFRGLVAAATTLCMLAAQHVEPSAATPDAVVLPPTFDGELAVTHRTAIVAAFTEGLHAAGVTHVRDASPPCTDADCRRSRVQTAASAFAIELAITVVDRDYQLTTRLFDGAGLSLAEVEQRCAICSLAEVEALAQDQARAIAAKLIDVDALATVAISTTPAGAAVRVDGVVQGATPIELRLPAGEHVVALSRRGFAVAERRLRLVARTREQLSVSLPPERPTIVTRPSVAPVDVRPRRALVGAGASSLALGVAAVAASVPLFLLDADAPRGGCTGLDVDFAGNCRRIYRTRGGGVSAATAGVVAIATGIALLVLGTRPARARGRR